MITQLPSYVTGRLDTKTDWISCIRQFSCILKASCRQDRSMILERVRREDFLTAKNLLLLLYQKDHEAKINKEKLSGHGLNAHGHSGLSEADFLNYNLPANTWLARKYAEWVQRLDQIGGISDNLARLRQHTCDVNGCKLVKSVIDSCNNCHKKR